MNEIICPHCNKALKIDEAGYADILKQVRDSTFEQQLHERLPNSRAKENWMLNEATYAQPTQVESARFA